MAHSVNKLLRSEVGPQVNCCAQKSPLKCPVLKSWCSIAPAKFSCAQKLPRSIFVCPNVGAQMSRALYTWCEKNYKIEHSSCMPYFNRVLCNYFIIFGSTRKIWCICARINLDFNAKPRFFFGIQFLI